MDTMTTEALREAQTPPTPRMPYQPDLSATLYLYDLAEPTIRLASGADPHVAVEVRSGGTGLAVACWSPATLRRFAGVCMAAADQLDDAIEDVAASDADAA